MKFLFFFSIFFVLYTYGLYPLVITVWARVHPRRVTKKYRRVPVSVVLAVRDEERHIETRIENLLAQDYPPEMVEVVVVSDGSTDRTVEIARSLNDDRVKIIETPGGGGKSAAVNVGVENATHDIVVFADARQRFGENAFAELTAMFEDRQVGAVSGELIIRKGRESEVGEGVGLYWQYEKLIRRRESEVDSVVGATGSIYAIRRALYQPLPPNTLLDDFVVPMRIVLQGSRVVFVRSAKAYDWAAERGAHEFRRKVRTLAGNFQAFALEPALLNPARNRVFFQMVSHKITRLVAPYFLLAALVSNLFLRGDFFALTLWLQLLFYATVMLGFTPLVSARVGGVIRVAWTFAVLNAAAVAGLWVFLTGRDKRVWKKSGM